MSVYLFLTPTGKKGGGQGLVMMSFFPQNFSKASHVTATSRQRLGFSAQHLWNRTSQGCQFPFLLLPLACPSPLVRAFILWWTQAPPGKGTLVLEVRDHFLDISLTSELQPGKYFGSRWGWGPGVSQIHQRTENGVERYFQKPHRVRHSCSQRNSC